MNGYWKNKIMQNLIFFKLTCLILNLFHLVINGEALQAQKTPV